MRSHVPATCFCCLLLSLVLFLTGCGPQPVTGGTKGSLRAEAGAQAVSEMQVAVFRQEGSAWQQVGFGVTGGDGSFELVKNQASGPLLLEPGAYRCTLESVGAPVTFPKQYTSAETTPWQVTWPTADQTLSLTAPITLQP